jgi:DNA repair protein RadD
MLTHVKELIEQNAARMLEHWPDAPRGIYSSGMGLRQLGNPITFAGIQSVRKRGSEIGHIDIIIIDECHLVGHKTEGGYRTLIDVLTSINPNLWVVGLTATPYRLGHGVITDKPAIFDELLQSIDIPELVHKEFLAKLRSKKTEAELDTSSVHKRGGEFIESELQAAVDTADQNQRVVDEVIRLAGDRRSWLFF